MKKNNFTLLEVLTALVVMSLGLPALLWQLSIAVNRAEQNRQYWETTHELSQAAEYLLLCGPDSRLDTDILSDEYQLVYRYLPTGLELSGQNRSSSANDRILQRLHLTLYRDGELLDELNLDCWVEND